MQGKFIFALKNKRNENILYLVVSDDAEKTIHLSSMKPQSGTFRSITPEAPQFHLFEREIYEQSGIKPEGHPWLKPVRFPSAAEAGSVHYPDGSASACRESSEVNSAGADEIIREADSLQNKSSDRNTDQNRFFPKAGDMDFFSIEGDEIHEVAVGPIHAGIIEPGHFRFQCHGEKVYHLEISLGYQHRGIEKALKGDHIKTPCTE